MHKSLKIPADCSFVSLNFKVKEPSLAMPAFLVKLAAHFAVNLEVI